MLVVALLIGLLYALPNLYGEDPAVQITGARGIAASESTLIQVQNVLQEQQITSKSLALESGAILARFSTPDIQLRAREALVNALGEKYVVALNLAPATPNWLRMKVASPSEAPTPRLKRVCGVRLKAYCRPVLSCAPPARSMKAARD